MTIVLPDHSDRMPQLKKSQVSLVYRSKGFVPPHELVSQQDILASSLPADPTGASVRTTFRPVSPQHFSPSKSCAVLQRGKLLSQMRQSCLPVVSKKAARHSQMFDGCNTSDVWEDMLLISLCRL